MKQFKRVHLGLLIMCASLSIYATANIAQVNPQQVKIPAQAIENIPQGRLKQSLSKLPQQIQERVLQKLSGLGIPSIDLLLMDVDDSGELFYIEEGLVDLSGAGSEEASSEILLPPVDVFKLHSNPDSPNKIFLDFDGGLISGRAWGGGATYNTLPYDLDTDPSTFNETERYRIHEIWTRIADDFAAFDVDVTTEAPQSFGPNTGWLLFTKDSDRDGVPMPAQGAGGVAYLGVWGRSNYTHYQPALVYYNRLGGGAANFMAEAGSHEMGHNFALSHDGTSTTSYYKGLGADTEPSSWAPIMGVGYYKNVTQWSRGEYPDANQTQDDIGIIFNQLNGSADVEGGNNNPVTLLIDENGQFVATNREIDPDNQVTDNKGGIQVSDTDRFQFIAGAGPAQFTATPAWDAFTRNSRRGSNLDIGLRLYDSQGTLIVDISDDYETAATLSVNLADGLHFLEIYGSQGLYASDYGSQGYYYLSGQITQGVTDITPPDPNPMSFIQAPIALSANQIEMQAVAASDDLGGSVSYQFICTAGGPGCLDSQWQTATDYVLSGLAPQSQYCFAVMARDMSGNTTLPSAEACVSTPIEPPKSTPPKAPTDLVVSDGQNGTAQIVWIDTSDNETAFVIERETLHKNGRWQATEIVATLAENVVSYVDASGKGSFRFRIQATNSTGSSQWTEWSTVSITSNDDGGGQKPCRGKKCSG